jgi:PIN domain nuclease of toxin-antitoxin system
MDTHTVFWFAVNSLGLSRKAKQLVLDNAVKKYVSIASAWGFAIKMGLKKTRLDAGTLEFFSVESCGTPVPPPRSF